MMAFVVLCCAGMAWVEIVAEPAYWVKSGVKVLVFLVVPLLVPGLVDRTQLARALTLDRRGAVWLLGAGVLLYGGILGAFALTRPLFDYGQLVRALSADQKVDGGSFLWTALYISFGNSFLEEFFFRFLAFLQLSRCASRGTAYGFSAAAFAAYHVGMIGGSFPPLLLALCLAGLAAGGLLFSFADERGGSVYHSWIVHLCADLAIMTIWYLHI